MEGEGVDIFDLSNFDFIPIDTDMVGDKIRDTPRNEPLGEVGINYFLYHKDFSAFLHHQHKT